MTLNHAKKLSLQLLNHYLKQWKKLFVSLLDKKEKQIKYSALPGIIAACCLLTACSKPADETMKNETGGKNTPYTEASVSTADNTVKKPDSKNTEVNNTPNRFFGDMETSTRFTAVERDKPLRLPSDHKSHPDFQLEWWYLTFVLESETGDEIGLQYTLFRFNTSDDAHNDATSNSWSNGQQWMGHASLHTANTHYFEERFASGGVGNAYVRSQPFSAAIDDWVWESSVRDTDDNNERESMFPSTLSFAFGQPKQVMSDLPEKENEQASSPAALATAYKLNDNAVAVSLNLTSSGPFIKHGEKGFSKKTEDGRLRSYYYSQPFIQAEGAINIDGKAMNVKGNGWFDHEWTSHLANNQAMGWDWFSLHLSDGSKLMAFRMHAANQSEKVSKDNDKHGESHVNEVFTTASYIAENGNKETLSQNDISISPLKNESIQRENSRHVVPSHWQIKIPSKDIDVTVSAFKKDQWNDSVFPYYEGRVQVKGSHSGSGFMELTGY